MSRTPARAYRRRAVRRVAAVALALAMALPLGPTQAQVRDAASEAPALAGLALLTALRRGGYILYFRHTATDFAQSDDIATGYDDCARQRGLTDQGRSDARAIGAAIRKLGIPIGDVLASPYCRTRETAELMFGRGTPVAAVRGGPAQADAARYAELISLMSAPVAGGANLVVSGHGNPFRAVAGGPWLAEGEAAVVAPRGREGFVVVARIRRDDWAGLATAKQ